MSGADDDKEPALVESALAGAECAADDLCVYARKYARNPTEHTRGQLIDAAEDYAHAIAYARAVAAAEDGAA